MTAAPDRRPGEVPARVWEDTSGGVLRLGEVWPGSEVALITTNDHTALTPDQLRELGAEAFERAEVMENHTGRYRRTWRWHVTKGEQLLSQADNAVNPDRVIQRAKAHFLAAAVLRGQRSIHLTTIESGKDTE